MAKNKPNKSKHKHKPNTKKVNGKKLNNGKTPNQHKAKIKKLRRYTPSLSERVMEVCLEGFEARKDVEVEWMDEHEFTVHIKKGNAYEVEIEDADADEDEIGGGVSLKDDEHPAEMEELTDHNSVLDYCLLLLAKDAAMLAQISDVMTDGDAVDCEAVFKLGEEGYRALRVRPHNGSTAD